ncbi:MAG: sugar transferase [Clostridiales bacterium]|nr:sugar transferase [Clostridiales bacterium]
MIYRILKRMFDFSTALLLFLMISPLFLVIMILVRVNLGSPIFFSQIRSGFKQRPFNIIKFRTMTNEKDTHGHLLPDDKRKTAFGCFLRSTSLDELPELLSIIKGDMSVIGPRPLPLIYNDYYTEREKLRFEVKGGLLPPDSIESSVIISWSRQLECEAKYAEELSLKNDVKIFFCTFGALLKRNHIDYGAYVRKPLDEERQSK